MNDILLRVVCADFCAAAVFSANGGIYVCTEAAPKLQALIGMDLEKATRRIRANGWDAEQLRVMPELEPSRDPRDPSGLQDQALRFRASGRFVLL